MKRYEFVPVDIYGVFSSGSKEHRQIIREYAAKGYRYVGYIPTHISNNGKVTEIDLVFEIDE